MKELEKRILKEGIILKDDVLKVGHFLNQQVDVKLLKKMAEEVKKLFKDVEITKILTVEASGLPFATAVALLLDVPLVFAKKEKTTNVSGDVVTAVVESYTHKNVNVIYVTRDYIKRGEKVLIVDDFLARGNALRGLIEIVNNCNAFVVGCAIQIEKAYQGGGDDLRSLGYRVESLAKIVHMDEKEIKFQ